MTNKKYRHNEQNLLVANCERCNNENLVSRMARLKGLLCDSCFQIREKEVINDWKIEYKRHMNGDGDGFKKIMTAPKLSTYLN